MRVCLLSLCLCSALGSQTCSSSDTAALLRAQDVSVVFDEEVDVPFGHLLDYWREGGTHKRFLLAVGDLQPQHGEWTRGSVSETFLGLSHSHSRNFSFAHPRTSLLMFGPRNAMAQQTQFLADDLVLAPTGGDSTRAIIVTTVTRLSGFPLSDKFKVVQYWTATETGDPRRTRLTLGVRLDFSGDTMFRRQIVSGTEVEARSLCQNWARYLLNTSRE